MTDGFLPVDKPEGPTSHDAVALARRALRTRRVGHAGTLDPFATGLLLLLAGRGTRLAPYLVGLPKAYAGVLRLGVTTATDDRTGAPLTTSEAWRPLTDAAVADAMRGFLGRYAQRPPAYSALKVGGLPAHRRVRRGEAVALAAREVEVRRFRFVAREGPDVTFEAEVGSGTYVRALARDLGERLACGAHLRALRRTAVGPFLVAEATPLDEVRRGTVALRPLRDAVRHLPAHAIDADGWDAVRQGRPIPADASGAAAPEERIALLREGRLVAVAEREGDRWWPRVVLES